VTDQLASWITDPDDPADIPAPHTKSAADTVAAMFPDLVDKSNDGPLGAHKQAAQEVIDKSSDRMIPTMEQLYAPLCYLDKKAYDECPKDALGHVAGINRTNHVIPFTAPRGGFSGKNK
jgi:hypothetical protein